MKRIRKIFILSLALCMLLSLCACGKAPEQSDDGLPTVGKDGISESGGKEISSDADLVPGFKSEEISLPPDLGRLSSLVQSIDHIGDTMYFCNSTRLDNPVVYAYDTLNGEWSKIECDAGEARFPYVRALSAADNSLWILIEETASNEQLNSGKHPNDLGYYVMHIDLSTGQCSSTKVGFKGDAGTESSSYIFSVLIGLTDERALLCSPEKYYVIDKDVNVLESDNNDLIAGDGRYFRVNGEKYFWSGEGYSTINPDTLAFSPALNIPIGHHFWSNTGSFLMNNNEDLCKVNPETGAKQDIFKWMDVALGIDSISAINLLENSEGNFFYISGYGKFIKVCPAMVPVKKTMTMAVFGDSQVEGYEEAVAEGWACPYDLSQSLEDAIIRFNNQDSEYRIEIKPIIFKGTADRDRILMELSTGSGVDLIDTSLFPAGAVDAGMLVDLLPYIDKEFSRDEFITPLFNAMLRKGGLYEFTEAFELMTVLVPTAQAESGEWTSEKMLELINDTDDYFFNFPKENLLTAFCWAASAEFTDLETGSCDFENPLFIQWLEFLKAAPEREQPEWGQKMPPMPLLVYPYFSGHAGYNARRTLEADYAVAGFPGAESTGSYFRKMSRDRIISDGYAPFGYSESGNTSVGIMASSENIEGALRFMRVYIAGNPDHNFSAGIPVRKDRFDKILADAGDKTDGSSNTPIFTPEDAEILKNLVYSTDKVVIDDPAVEDILMAEINAFIGGKGTAEECAAQIQSRMSILLSEQYG